jgi:Fe-S cluster biogenesis protein NfuA
MVLMTLDLTNDNSAVLESVTNDIGQIVSRDGGLLEFGSFDAATAQLTVSFRKASEEDCTSCTIDESTVRMFLEEAARAQGVELASLEIVAAQ